MDCNYLYMQMAQKGEDKFNEEDYSNFQDDEGNVDIDKVVSTGLGILGVFSTWNKNRKENQSRDTTFYPPPPPPKKNNTALYAVGGLAVVGIGIGIYFAVRKK